eukprot:15474480-Alexandrium_andersonii.AAC.1
MLGGDLGTFACARQSDHHAFLVRSGPCGPALPESMGSDDPRTLGAVRWVQKGVGQDHEGVFVAKPTESEVPTFHHQDPR